MITPTAEKMELGKFHTWMESDGIARTVVKPGAEIFLQDAKENTAAVEAFFPPSLGESVRTSPVRYTERSRVRRRRFL